MDLVKDEPKVIKESLEPLVGTVIIRTKPSRAVVYLDGKRKGKTPITLRNISGVKPHKFVLKRKRYATLKFEINPSDWPDALPAELTMDKELKRIRKRHRRRRRR